MRRRNFSIRIFQFDKEEYFIMRRRNISIRIFQFDKEEYFNIWRNISIRSKQETNDGLYEEEGRGALCWIGGALQSSRSSHTIYSQIHSQNTNTLTKHKYTKYINV